MVYKVEVVNKDNMTEIRYIGNNDTVKLGKIIELDEFRDIANSIMQNNPKITYDRAFSMAKELRYKKASHVSYDTTEMNNEEVLDDSKVINFEPAKVKVLSLDKNAS